MRGDTASTNFLILYETVQAKIVGAKHVLDTAVSDLIKWSSAIEFPQLPVHPMLRSVLTYSSDEGLVV